MRVKKKCEKWEEGKGLERFSWTMLESAFRPGCKGSQVTGKCVVHLEREGGGRHYLWTSLGQVKEGG